jgi:hypothetical protein
MCIAISITNNPDWRLPHDVQADRCGQPARAPTAYGYGQVHAKRGKEDDPDRPWLSVFGALIRETQENDSSAI